MATKIRRHDVRDGLNRYFNREEISSLCFDLQIDYDNLAGETKRTKIEKFIELLEREDRLYELIHLLQRVRPNALWSTSLELTGHSPYKGLSAFQENDAQYFFGRESFTKRLLESVHRKVVTTIIGPSGSGKSSVLFAGLFPQLRSERRWAIIHMRPGDHPFHALATILLESLETRMSETDRLLEVGKLAGALQNNTLTLESVLRRIVNKNSEETCLILVIDQFEELFTSNLNLDDQENFLIHLQEVASYENDLIRIVVALRADFLGRALNSPSVLRILQTNGDEKLGPMSLDELERAIQLPVTELGFQFEPGLVERILDDVGNHAGSLPLMQFALTLLWEHRREGILTHTAYETIGTVRGALARYAEEIYERLNVIEKRQARFIFVQLVRPGESTENVRRLSTRRELETIVSWQSVEKLVGTRLIVTGHDSVGNETIELIHETLIFTWPRFREWLLQDQEFRLWQERHRALLGSWHANDRDGDSLLKGATLAEAENWYQKYQSRLSKNEQEFIQTSVEAKDHEEKLRKRTKSIKSTLVVLGLCLAMFLGLAFWVQNLRIKQENRVAVARLLAAQAELVRNQGSEFFERSILLAVESISRFPSLEAEQVVRHGLNLMPIPLNNFDHERGVYSFEMNSERTLVVTAGSDQTVRIWDVNTGVELSQIVPDIRIRNLEISSDGKLLAMLGADDTVRLWSIDSATEIGRITYSTLVNQMVLSPDGSFVVVSTENSVVIWDVESLNQLLRIEQPESVFNIEFNSDSSRFAISTSSGGVMVYERTSHSFQLRSILFESTQSFQTVRLRFSSNGSLLAVAKDQTVTIFEVDTASQIFNRHFDSNIYDIDFGPDDQFIATSSGSGFPWSPSTGTVQTWEINSVSQFTDGLLIEGVASDINFSPSGRYLMTLASNYTLHVWRVSDRKEIARINDITDASFLSGDKELITLSVDDTVRTWQISGGEALLRLTPSNPFRTALSDDWQYVAAIVETGEAYIVEFGGNWNEVTHFKVDSAIATVSRMIFAPGNQILATMHYQGELDYHIKLWQVTNGSEIAHIKTPYIPNVVEFSPNGNLMATAHGYQLTQEDESSAHIWQTKTGKLLITIRHMDNINSVIFSPDGRFLVSGSDDGVVKVWDINNFQVIESFDYKLRIGNLIFSPNGQYLLIIYDYDQATILETSTWEEILTLQDVYYWDSHKREQQTALFTLDGRFLAVANRDNSVRVWDMTKLAEAARLYHEDAVADLAFSSDGTYLATASGDGLARVWDLDSGEEIARMTHELSVETIAFSPENSVIKTTTREDFTLIWIIWPRDLIEAVCERLTRNLTAEEWQRYISDQNYQATCPEVSLKAIDVFRYAQYLDRQEESTSQEFLAQAIELAVIERNFEINEEICREGLLSHHAVEVLPVCEQNFELANDEDERDSARGLRALAYSLVGNYALAASDLKYFLPLIDEAIREGDEPISELREQKQRIESWIRELEANRNPFDEGTLNDLLR